MHTTQPAMYPTRSPPIYYKTNRNLDSVISSRVSLDYYMVRHRSFFNLCHITTVVSVLACIELAVAVSTLCLFVYAVYSRHLVVEQSATLTEEPSVSPRVLAIEQCLYSWAYPRPPNDEGCPNRNLKDYVTTLACYCGLVLNALWILTICGLLIGVKRRESLLVVPHMITQVVVWLYCVGSVVFFASNYVEVVHMTYGYNFAWHLFSWTFTYLILTLMLSMYEAYMFCVVLALNRYFKDFDSF